MIRGDPLIDDEGTCAAILNQAQHYGPEALLMLLRSKGYNLKGSLIISVFREDLSCDVLFVKTGPSDINLYAV